VYQSDITGGSIHPCHESMSIDEFKREDIPWDRLAFDTTKNALKRYIEKKKRSLI
ncbi:MAG: NUDIX hydrolase, partial [Deltaproteobacteria bacterium]